MTLKDWEHVDYGRGSPSDASLYRQWIGHWSANQSNPEIHRCLKHKYSDHALVVTMDRALNLFTFPEARLTLHGTDGPLSHVIYEPPPRRGAGPGQLVQDIQFGTYRLDWKSEIFLVVIAEWLNNGFQPTRVHAVLRKGPDVSPINALITAASAYATELREEIFVFNQGVWDKDHDLWLEVQKADWTDIILDEEFKETIHKDVTGFFKSEKIYKDLAIPWKRGIIFWGPPGNGKTMTLKAIMKESANPCLYVKSFHSWMGDEGSIRAVFKKARQTSPCILVLEDLDSLITDENRSFFLNELDGLESNDGILVLGTTNHFDKLDPGLSNRPSRFDRKYKFDSPSLSERILYCKYWQRKLRTSKSINYPKTLIEKVAGLTANFSFAYIKETFVSTLTFIAGDQAKGCAFEDIIESQITSLREQLGHEGVRHPYARPEVLGRHVNSVNAARPLPGPPPLVPSSN
ncbi:P-loop containing nucleoside triphosphate hydrolase protein [Cantharellus anzutake]|uniref:P-loop containing nucleoside triphosphate hydrolase protein n=1 Tax=Cantharellus anzutake TaxID=1750568 RepID=UPI001904C328|nr:P-loop containing nucleoside triphosphate hydrolase protein [Cantharellus anzutake]KAF8338940.1 P-loop containing nucleoside triphosphate hydrolase protein [Cantharellus anzutake]